MKTLRLKDACLAFTLSAFLASPAPTLARETDQYMAWGHEIEDSLPKVHAWINGVFSKGLAEVNRKILSGKKKWANRYESCTYVGLDSIPHNFYLGVQPIETWILHNPDIDRYPKIGQYSTKQHIRLSYHHTMPFFFALAPILNLNGVYVSIDKVDHFLGLGHHLFNKYQRHLRKVKGGHEAALELTMRDSFKTEHRFLGSTTAQVSSYADHEANMQGVNFFLSLCDPKAAVHLEKLPDGTYQLANQAKIDFTPFINPWWDESFNPNSFTKRKRQRLHAQIRAKYCPKPGNEGVMDFVKEQYARYNSGRYGRPVTPKYEAMVEAMRPWYEDNKIDSFGSICKGTQASSL